ncbi:hypothetical protein TWF730_000112 [Orbilia blumenaviensis]|uniref:Spherulin 4-like cell surface protein n=1 Tax=Orbilia blumenaviensis TaxID=1796055 RepID=A0AAV9VLP6_9PEZI
MPKHCLFFTIIGIVIVVIVVGVTVPVVVIRKSHSSYSPLPPTNVSIILPLYTYPSRAAWDPVYEKLNNHSYSGIQWTIIINPSNGPGDELNANYRVGILRLNAAYNVNVVGYVFTDYGRRNIAEVETDIAKYASWGLFAGIFFDETPQGDNQSLSHSITYLKSITNNVRKTPGFIRQKTTVIHNPGTTVNSELLDLGQNITIIVEDTFTNYKSLAARQVISEMSANTSRTRLGCLIHSVPGNETVDNPLMDLLSELSQNFGHIFLTDKSSNYYNNYDGIWNNFINSTSLMY